jgi:hypothetical protein
LWNNLIIVIHVCKTLKIQMSHPNVPVQRIT